MRGASKSSSNRFDSGPGLNWGGPSRVALFSLYAESLTDSTPPFNAK